MSVFNVSFLYSEAKYNVGQRVKSNTKTGANKNRRGVVIKSGKNNSIIKWDDASEPVSIDDRLLEDESHGEQKDECTDTDEETKEIMSSMSCTYAVRAQAVLGGGKKKPQTWLLTREDTSIFAKIFHTEKEARSKSRFQRKIDSLKPTFGLIPLYFHLEGRALIARDLGHGGPYKTTCTEIGPMLDKDSSGAPPMETYIFKATTGDIEELTKILLFRCIFSVSDTRLSNIVYSERLGKPVSIDENGARQKRPLIPLETETDFWNFIIGTTGRGWVAKDWKSKPHLLAKKKVNECLQLNKEYTWFALLDTWKTKLIKNDLPYQKSQLIYEYIQTI